VLSRRAILFSSAALWGCRSRKATPYLGYCFVADQESHSLAVADLSTFRTWHSIALPDAPTAVLAHPHHSKVFALAGATGTIFEIDVASLAISRHARAGTNAVSMQFDPDGNAIWVLYREPAALVEFPCDALRSRRQLALGMPPDGFNISPNRRAAIASNAGQSVLIASLDRTAVENTVRLAAAPSLVSFQQKGLQIIAASHSAQNLTIIEAVSGRVLVVLPVPIRPRHFCFSADEGQLFVTGQGRDAVVIVYPYTTEIGETILAGRSPAGMAVVNNILLVTNPETNTVTALDIDTRKLLAVIEVGQEPREILITPDNQYALVLDQKSGDLAVIRVAALTGRDWVRRYKSAPLFTVIPVGRKPVSAAVVRLA